jgi:glyoxylase-like metal-dependent hydrolase (beta-lactamase superfamily II)
VSAPPDPPAPAALPDFGVGPAPEPGRLDLVAPGVRRLTAPNPGLMTGPGTNTYLVGTKELVVVDPGPVDEGHRAALVAAAEGIGPIRTIVVTHTHIDHAPGAAALAEVTGAEVLGFGPAEQFEPDRRVGEGATLSVPGDTALSLRAVHTPGHASDHLCWLIPEHGLLLTGDHVMHGSTVVIRPPDGDVATYLASLERLLHLQPAVRQLAPGHGRIMEQVDQVVARLIEHRLARHELIAAALRRRGESTVEELLPDVYADVTEQQLPVARFSLWAHLRFLAQQGRAASLGVEPGADGLETAWRWVEGTAA